ncbi:hypothetical protein ATANTOWER_015881 [Ataeniobius toweri]|uniref:Uncharacterized protein n=1 Tax=Ataeniobius toweri TaxID=208326 RepID=A0ABU7C7V2_9TELE|nr:hypothetical protein [Ataeniobius toweri]
MIYLKKPAEGVIDHKMFHSQKRRWKENNAWKQDIVGVSFLLENFQMTTLCYIACGGLVMIWDDVVYDVTEPFKYAPLLQQNFL